MTRLKQNVAALRFGDRLTDILSTTTTWFGAAVLSSVVLLSTSMVFSIGICCADDAAYAVVAKNLAAGRGYSTNIDPAFERAVFSPVVSAAGGPALIIPVSVAIRLTGNKFWVPGLVHIGVWFILLVLLWRAVRRVASTRRASLAGGVFLLIAFAVSPYHVEHWYAMLGEIPAAFLILLAFVLWALNPSSSRRLALASAVLAVAFLYKVLILLYFIAFLISVTVWYGREDPDRSMTDWFARMALACATFVAPVIAFEAWKIGTLGWHAYVSNLALAIQFAGDRGLGRAGIDVNEILTRLLLFHTRFGAPLESVLLLVGLSGYLCLQGGISTQVRRLYILLSTAIIFHIVYWLFLSVGAARYVFIGLVLSCAALSLPFLVVKQRRIAILYVGAMTVAFMGTTGRLTTLIRQATRTGFSASPSRVSQQRVVGFLEQHDDLRPFGARWWAPIADLEYLLNGAFNFTQYASLDADQTPRRFLLVTNTRFDTDVEAKFLRVIETCGSPAFDAPPYRVYVCGSGSGRGRTDRVALESQKHK